VFARHDFRVYWLSLSFSVVSRSMLMAALAWLALALTGSPVKLAIVGGIQFVPSLLFSLFAGGLVDRMPRRLLLIVNSVAAAAIALALAALALAEALEYWHLIVAALALGVVMTLDWPARQSFLGDIAGSALLFSALALVSATQQVGWFFGPLIAGGLAARVGMGTVFVASGAISLAAALSLLGVPADRARLSVTRTPMLRGIGEALGYVWRTEGLVIVLGLVAALNIFVLNFQVLVTTLAQQALRLGPDGYGLLMSCMGVGACGGSIGLALVARGRPALALVVCAALATSAATMALAAAADVAPAAVLLGAVGVFSSLFQASSIASVQLMTPHAIVGRVLGVYSLLLLGMTPIGFAFTGLVAERGGISAAFAADGGLGLACCAILAAWWLRMRARLDPLAPVAEQQIAYAPADSFAGGGSTP